MSKQSLHQGGPRAAVDRERRDAPAGAVGALSDAERITLVTRPLPEPESPGAGSS
ncbi:hypothetical protein ACFWPV_31095 [Streptomyces uncialis]|uniref:hypothetical protein n=1 Tax=Streptomyces uncialis TaxID=1048205 RepID=UPI0036684FFA